MEQVYTVSDGQKMCFVMEKDDFKKIEGKDYKSKDGIHLLPLHYRRQKSTQDAKRSYGNK